MNEWKTANGLRRLKNDELNDEECLEVKDVRDAD